MAVGNPKTLLLVEDEYLYAMLEQQQLEAEGYRVIHASTGEDAVRLVEEEVVDLILMDIDLGPGMDGPETAIRILKHHTIPVLFLSSHTEVEVVEKTEKITSYGYVVKDANPNVLFTSIKMAFKLHNAHREILEKDNDYRILFENSINAVGLHEIILDDAGNAVDYVFLQVNSAFEAHTGLSAADIIGKRVTEAYPGIEKSGLIEIYGKVALTGESTSFETYLELTDQYFNISAYQAGPNRFAVVFENITARKHFEENLREKTQFIESLVNLSPDILYIYDLNTRKNVFTNDGVQRVLGYSISEIQKMGDSLIADLMHPDDFPVYCEVILPRYAKAADGELINHQYRMRHRDGSWRFLQSSESIYKRNPDSTPAQIFGVIHDISEMKKAEESLDKLIKEKELLLRESHHRVKNNMSAVQGILMLHSNSLKNTEAKNIVSNAAERVHRLQLLYDKLYRSENRDVETFSGFLPSLITELLVIASGKRIIRTEISIDDFTVSRNLLSPVGIIINEMVTNSLKYAFDGVEDPCITVVVSKKDGIITIEYSDNGKGCDGGDTPASGDGFGLKLIRMLTTQIHGTLERVPAKGVGYRINVDTRAEFHG